MLRFDNFRGDSCSALKKKTFIKQYHIHKTFSTNDEKYKIV